MTTSTGARTIQGIVGDVERCCPVACDYRPEIVAVYVGMIRHARARGIDLTAELAGSRGGDDLGRAPGISTSLDIRVLRRIWDVEMAMRSGAVTVEEICRKLCPWSLDD